MNPVCLVAVAAIACTSMASAQSSWSAVASGTTQHLRGGCHNGSTTFVVVGDAGTILTSPDGTAWSSRNSGTAEALQGVAHSPTLARYVAVGANGVACTSPDGATWTTGTTGVAVTLHAVAWGDGRFVAVGDGGTVLTSTNGTAWTAQSSGTTVGLRGVAWGGGQFVICGEQATLLSTADGTQFARRGIRATTALESVVFDGEQFLVSGEHGVMATAVDPHHWTLVESPSSSLTYFRAAAAATGYRFAAGTSSGGQGYVRSDPGSTASSALSAEIHGLVTGSDTVLAVGNLGAIFRLVASPPSPAVTLVAVGSARLGSPLTLESIPTGAPPLSYQWYRDSQLIAGATARTLSFASLQAGDAGSYQVRLTDRTGAFAHSLAVTVAVESVPPDGIAIDRSFSTFLPVAPDVVAATDARKIYVAGPMFFYPGDVPQYGIARLNRDGSIDPAFRINATPFSPRDGISTIQVQPDQSILVGGSSPLGQPVVARFLADGTWDATYVPIVGIALASGGSVRFSSVVDSVVTCTRYDAGGSAIDSFAVDLDPDNTLDGFTSLSSRLHAIDAQGRIVVAYAAFQGGGTGMFGQNASRLFRLLPDGTRDPAFGLVSLSRGLTGLWCDRVSGRFYVRSVAVGAPMGSVETTTFARLDAQGALDASYPERAFTTVLSDQQKTVSTFGTSADGSFLVTSSSLRSGDLHNGDTVRIVRYDADGLLDPKFSAGLNGLGVYSSIAQIVPQSDGALIVSTRTSHLAQPGTHYLARLFPVTGDPSTRLFNISTRCQAGTDSETLIVGFYVSGQGTKSMLVRGIGPGLVPHGVADPLPDPMVQLFAGSAPGLSNDDWSLGSNPTDLAATAARLGAFSIESGSRDAALMGTFAAGSHTMHVSAARGSQGVALAEAYDADAAPSTPSSIRIRNFSSRSRAGSGSATLIAGFSIEGTSSMRVLVRAVGPGLVPHQVSNTLANPRLTLFAGQQPIATNDDWGSDPTLAATFSSVSAFALAAGSHDAAILVTLAPGTYTAHVQSADGGTGVALVEVYEVP